MAKAFDSRVAALMININPSDIKGPLSRYQATRLDREDFYQLIQSINKVIENPLDNVVLQNLFNALWEKISSEISKVVSDASKSTTKSTAKDRMSNAPLEEILQLLRKQNALLSNPEMLLPPDYFQHIQRSVLNNRKPDNLIPSLLRYLENYVEHLERYHGQIDFTILEVSNFGEIFMLLQSHIRRNFPSSMIEKYELHLRQLEKHYNYLVRSRDNNRTLSIGSGIK